MGIKGADGRVLVPPTEYDPMTGEDLTEMVEVGPAGTVTTWAWVRQPGGEGAARPALRLGADPARRRRHRRCSVPSTPARIEAMSTGMKVEPVGPRSARARSTTSPTGSRWRHDRDHTSPTSCRDVEPVRAVRTPAEMSSPTRRARRAAATSRASPRRRSSAAGWPRAPRSTSRPRRRPELGKPTLEQVEVADRGTLVSFCVVNVPFHGGTVEIPYTTRQHPPRRRRTSRSCT